MNMIPVKSSAVSAIGHDGETLTVQYASGGLYKIEGVTPEQFTGLLASESIGRALNAIKAECACTKVEERDEPGDPDGEDMFRDRDAEYREQQADARRLK